MVLIVVPLLQGDVVRWLDILKNFFQLFRDSIVNDLAPILHDENQMVVKGEHRMIIAFQNHCKPSSFPFNSGYTTKEEKCKGPNSGAVALRRSRKYMNTLLMKRKNYDKKRLTVDFPKNTEEHYGIHYTRA